MAGLLRIPKLNDLPSTDLLTALLASSGLTGRERNAFSDMLSRLQGGRIRRLTADQRAWAERRYTDLDLQAEQSLNLASSGRVPVDFSQSPRVLESVLGSVPEEFRKPLRPPGQLR